MRAGYGLRPKRNFYEVNPDPSIWKLLERVYKGNVNICHTMVCGLAEPAYANYSPIGELFSHMWAEQMVRSRDGDAFWYEKEFCI